MEQPLKFDKTVKAVKLINKNCNCDAEADLNVQIVGWGAMNWDFKEHKAIDFPITLKLGEYKLMSNNTCQNAIKFKLPANRICTKPLHGDSSACVVSFRHYLHLVPLLPERALFIFFINYRAIQEVVWYGRIRKKRKYF